MATVSRDPSLDNMDSWLTRTPPEWEDDATDLAWLASLDDSARDDDPAFLAWIAEQEADMDGLAWLTAIGNTRHGEDTDPSGAKALAASAILDLLYDLRFHRCPTLARYLDSPHTRPTVAALVALTVPGPSCRRVSGFAAELDRLAEEYLQLGTVAGRLAAWAVEDLAHDVEWYGSGNLVEWELDRAAFHAACRDFDALCMEGR